MNSTANFALDDQPRGSQVVLSLVPVRPERFAAEKETKTLTCPLNIPIEDFYTLVCEKFGDSSLKAFFDNSCSHPIDFSKNSLWHFLIDNSPTSIYLESLHDYHDAISNELYESIFEKIYKTQETLTEQKMNPDLCKHAPNQKCMHCLSIHAWDEKYLKADGKGHKYLPFALHMHKTFYENKSSFQNTLKLPEMPRYSVLRHCIGHAPWPQGSCMKCLPQPDALHHQRFRYVDYVSFDNGNIIDNFLNSWRKSGGQRIGFLIGSLDTRGDAKFAVQTRVHAIYEPDQIDSLNFVEICKYPEDDPTLCYILKKLNLQIVGTIFTDLVNIKDEESNSLKLKNFRNHETYLISAEECIFAAKQQLKYPFTTKYSPSKKFGSTYVTVIVSADENHEIEFSAYQVSNQCMSLAEAGIIVPTKDYPDLAAIRESSNTEDYIPNIKYTLEMDGSKSVVDARPFPIDYMFVTVPVGFSQNEKFTWSFASKTATVGSLAQTNGDIVDIAKRKESLDDFKDFKLILDICEHDKKEFYRNADFILNAITKSDSESFAKFLSSDFFPKPLTASPDSNNEVNLNTPPGTWSCTHCTFINEGNGESCEICNLPRYF